MTETLPANGESTRVEIRRVRKVWIDQDLCTGDGLCVEIVPEVFEMGDDGVAYVKEDGVLMDDPGGDEQLANVPPNRASEVIEAAQECPGECIFLADAEGKALNLALFD